MDDKIEQFISIFGRNKKSLIYMLIVYALIALIVIAIIWWPKEKRYAEYEKLDIEAKQTRLAQSYVNTISNMFRNSKTDDIKSLISREYLKYTGKSVDQIIKELYSMGFLSQSASIKGVNLYVDKDTYVYSTTIYSGTGNSKSINIIEKQPYEYEIVFDDFYSYDDYPKTVNSENIEFKIESTYRNLKYVEINMKIKNLNDTYARFDFNSIDGVYAILEDGTRYAVTNLVSSEPYTNIEPNMTIKKNFVFEIPAQLQEGLKYIIFNGVNIKFSTMNIKVSV